MMTENTRGRSHPGPETLERIAEDGAATGAEREHLTACGECRQEMEWLRGFQAAVARMPERRPSRGFVDRVMDHVSLPRREESPADLPAWERLPGWLGAAAAAMVAVTAAAGWTWIVSRPDVSPGILAGLALEAAQGVLVKVSIEVGEFLVASGIAPALVSLFEGLSTTSALGALAAMGTLGLAAVVAATAAVRRPATWHTLNT